MSYLAKYIWLDSQLLHIYWLEGRKEHKVVALNYILAI